MFTVKATYRNETRKFPFESSSFPTFQQLYTQLYRVFPIHNSYYLSKLLFSPDSKVLGRILIGKEAHSAEEYDKHIAPYQGRSWPNAVLKFSVFDENPHKPPSSALSTANSMATDENADSNSNSNSNATASVNEGASMVSEASSATVVPATAEHVEDRFKRFAERKLVVERLREKMANRPRSDFIDFSSEHTSSSPLPSFRRPSLQTLLESDIGDRSSRPLPDVPEPVGSNNGLSAKSVSPQSALVNESQSLSGYTFRSRLPAFLESRPRSSVSSTHSTQTPLRSLTPPRPLVIPPPPVIFPSSSSAAKDMPLVDVDVEMASPKVSRVNPSSTRTAQKPLPAQSALHGSFKKDLDEIKEMLIDMRGEMKKSSSTSTTPTPPAVPPPPSVVPQGNNIGAFSFNPPPLPTPVPCNLPSLSSSSSSYQPAYLSLPPVLTTTQPIISSGQGTLERLLSNPIAPPTVSTNESLDRLLSSTRSMVQQHTGITCDGCGFRGMMGVRHKCLECDDYDLCTACMGSPSVRNGHNYGHNFWPIDQPGNKDAYNAARRSLQAIKSAQRVPTRAFHPHITCDVCRISGISGVRFKCLECEDYDVCETCMWSPAAQAGHPPHAFWPINDPANFASYGRARQQRSALHTTPRVSRTASFSFNPTTKIHNGINCDGCERKPVTGVRFKCLQCEDFDLCRACLSNPSVLEKHSLEHKFWPVNEPGDMSLFDRVKEQLEDKHESVVVHEHITCDGCDTIVVGIRHKCLECDDYDFCTACLSDPKKREQHSLTHVFFPITTPGDKSAYHRAHTQRLTLPSINSIPPPQRTVHNIASGFPVVHENIQCDACLDTIIGIRYKCLDCPDFDLCQDCRSGGAIETHNSSHSFFQIDKPGDVYVHTVFSGDGERIPPVGRSGSGSAALTTSPRPTSNQHAGIVNATTTEPVAHNATCNLCDSRIRGDRYKCVNCPDFDTCTSCFAITSEHHPGHGFVKIQTPEVLIMRNALGNDVTHPASCNNCNELIRGTRYKCMHLSCPDYDLCQNCEAHPFPIHPDNHPMLKLKNTRIAVPTVVRDTPAQAAVSIQTSTPVAMEVEDEQVGTVRELRRAYRDMAQDSNTTQVIGEDALYSVAQHAETLDTVMHSPFFGMAEPEEPIRNIRSAYRSMAQESSPHILDAGAEFIRRVQEMQPATEADTFLSSTILRNVAGASTKATTAADTHLDYAFVGKLNAQARSKATSAADSHLDDALMDMLDTQAHSRPHLDNSISAGAASEDQTEISRMFRELSREDMPPAPQESQSTPMNVDDPREVHKRYRSLFATDSAAQVTPEVAQSSAAVADEMREVRRKYRDLFSQPSSRVPEAVLAEERRTRRKYRDLFTQPTSRVTDAAPFIEAAVSAFEVEPPAAEPTFADHFFSTQDANRNYEAESPTLPIPSIPPLIPATWSPPRWCAPTSNLVAQHLTEYTKPRVVSPAPVVEEPVMEQSIVPPVTLNEEFLVRSALASSRLTPASSVRPLTPPAERLVDVDEPAKPATEADASVDEAVASTLGGLTTPSDLPESKSASTPGSIPRLPVRNEWPELWPELTTMLKHLLQPPAPEASVSSTVITGGIHVEEAKHGESKEVSSSEKEFHTAVEESPLAREALLTRPEGSATTMVPPRPRFDLKEYLSSLVPKPSLVATYVSDNNIPDGQIFPPGAEFVKAWCMRNDGESAWPETTELTFVAGDRLSHDEAVRKVKVGSVAPGAQVEVVGAEMKAPDVPGKYVSYWRLNDGAGNFFGHSVWVDISVAEMNCPASKSSSEGSLASSSVIMPQPLENAAAMANAPASTSSITIPSNPPSDDGSFESSISLINAPSSPSIGDDDAIYEDSRSNALGDRPRDLEYVVLYDTSSSESED